MDPVAEGYDIDILFVDIVVAAEVLLILLFPQPLVTFLLLSVCI